MAAARANLQQSELNLGYTKIYAPLDGYLTNVNTSPGAYVHTDDQLLALVDSSSFWIAASQTAPAMKLEVRSNESGDGDLVLQQAASATTISQ